jgi:hypothetical protein
MPVRPPFIQKQQLLNSLVAYYRSTNQTLPPEVFNGEHDGAFKLGGVWIELIDLFMAVFRLGGLIKVGSERSPVPLGRQLMVSVDADIPSANGQPG